MKHLTEERTLKGLLLEMKLAPTTEERILAEEMIVNMHDQLREKCEGFEAENRELRLIEDTRWRPTVDKLRAQNEKLTVALKKFANWKPHPLASPIEQSVCEAFARASREALAGEAAEERLKINWGIK